MPKSRTPYLLAILAIVLLSSTYYYLKIAYPTLFSSTNQKLTDALSRLTQNQAASDRSDSIPTNTPLPSPYPLIPDQGTAGTFSVTHDSQKGPKITNIKIDPLAAEQNEKVTVELTLSHPNPVQSIIGTIQTDTTPITFKLSPASTTSLSQVWTGDLTLSEPFLYTYIYTFLASDGTHTSQLDMALRSK